MRLIRTIIIGLLPFLILVAPLTHSAGFESGPGGSLENDSMAEQIGFIIIYSTVLILGLIPFLAFVAVLVAPLYFIGRYIVRKGYPTKEKFHHPLTSVRSFSLVNRRISFWLMFGPCLVFAYSLILNILLILFVDFEQLSSSSGIFFVQEFLAGTGAFSVVFGMFLIPIGIGVRYMKGSGTG